MSILHSTRSRPIDSIFLEDGLVSGSNSIPSAAAFGPESAMVNEIFNNPDAWSVQFGVEGYMDSAGPTDVGLVSGSSLGSSMVGKGFRERRGENRNKGSVSPLKKKSSKNISQPEGYHLKRGSKLQLESFTLKSYHITPHLSSASSMSDSSSLDSSTPSLNSSLPTISDEDSVDSHSRSELAQLDWKGVKQKVDRRTDPLSLVALMEPSNTVSPEAGERVSILWSRQSVSHGFPSPKDDNFDSRDGVRRDSQSSTESSSNTLAMTSTLSRVERQSSPRVTKHSKRPSLKIATTTTTTTTTTMTTIVSVQSPVKTSPASVTVLSASATWSILELYGDSPKPSPKGFVVPKSSGHLHSSFKSSDIQQLPSRIPLPKSAFASKFPSQQLNPNPLAGSGIVELPADFVIPPLRSKSKLRGPRTGTVLVPASPLRITMTKQPSPPPLPKKESALSRSRSNGKVRPLPKPPRAHSPPPPVPSLPSVSTTKDPMPPLPKVPKSSPPPAYSVPLIPTSKDTDLPQKGKKSALRSRIAPPPLPLDGPLPPLPSHAPEKVTASAAKQSKEVLVKDVPHAPEPIIRSRTLQSQQQPLPTVTTSKHTDEQLQKTEKATPHLPKVEPTVRTRMPPPPPLSLDSPPLPPLPADASPKLKALDARGAIETVSREKEILPVPASEISSPTPEPEKKDTSLKPLRLADVTSSNPARPSRKGVVSPLPSPISDKANVLDTLLERNKLLSPSNPGHRSSASESSLGSAGQDTSATPSPLSPKKTLKKSLRKSHSFASLPKFSPDVPLPGASILAKRTRKDSTLVRPPLEPDDVHILVTPAPEVLVVAVSPSATEAISSTPSLPVPAALVPTITSVKGTTDNGSAIEGFSALQGQQKKDFLPQEPRQGSDQFSFPADRSLVPPSPIHRKGGSLSSVNVKPATKTHQKSSSLSFKPLIEPLHPDVGELARRLTTARKNSISTGFRPPFPDARPRLDSRDIRPSSDIRHSKDDSSSAGISVLKSSPEMVILYKPNVEEQGEASTDAPPRPSRRDPSMSSSLSSKNTLNATSPSTSTKTVKKVSSHSLLQSFESSSLVPDSATSTMQHRKKGSVSVRRPMVEDAALPGPGILAQRARTPSVLDNRLDVSDAFTPPTSSSSAHIVAPSALPHPGVPSTTSTESDMPLAAPIPIVAVGKWVPQLTSRLAETTKEPSKQVTKSAKPGLAGLRARARSMSGMKPTKVPAPPMPSLPSQTARDSPSLQVPSAPSVSRAASPSILVRNNTASPQPSFGHIRFRSIDKPARPVQPVVDEPPASLLSHSESSRGAGRSTETISINDEERASRPPSRGRQSTTGRAELSLADTAAAEESRPSYERGTESSRGRQRTSVEVASPRGRSVSATPSSRQQSTRKRAVSVAASPRKPLLPPPPLPLSPDIFSASDNLASAGSRGRISPFPSRPVSRASEGRSGAF